MARKFLYLIAAGVVAVILVLLALRMYARELTELALVPSTGFVKPDPLADNAYRDPALWYSRPGMGNKDPAAWQPRFRDGSPPIAWPGDASPKPFAVFFIHPTSYLDRSRWNAPIGDEEAERIARLYIRSMASPFARHGEIWAPKYRQATMGAMIAPSEDARRAIQTAYGDVEQAFDVFLDTIGKDRPIVLVGHSQGALHLIELLKRRFKDRPLAARLVAAYAVGWPISVEHDLADIGIPPCDGPTQSGCVLSWASFAEPADPSDLFEVYGESRSDSGAQRGDSPILCTNPLTGARGGAAPASRNLGTLVPDESGRSGELVPGLVGARCDKRGILLIGEPIDLGPYVLPGNNYHVYDIPLFWANTQLDAYNRVEAWAAAR